MKRKRSGHVLVIRHSEIDQPGAFGGVMEEAGIAWHPLDPWQGEPLPTLEDYDAVLAMGGPQQADEEHLYPWLATREGAAAGRGGAGHAGARRLPRLPAAGRRPRRHRGGAARGRGRHPRLLAHRGRPRRPALRRAPGGPAQHAMAPERGDRAALARGPARLLAGLRHPGVPARRAGLRRAVPYGGGRRAGAARPRPSPSTSRRWSASRARARSTAWLPRRQPRKRRCARTAAGSSRTSSA